MMPTDDEVREQARSSLHEACRRVSSLEADDFAYTKYADKLREARREQNAAMLVCNRLGIDVAAEIAGKGYLL